MASLTASANAVTAAQRLVIKIGSALLIKDGKLNATWVSSLVADIAACKARGQEVIVVSSGAVALGRAALNVGSKSLTLEESQAAAAAGQIALAHGWQARLAEQDLKAAQVLLTIEDTETRRRYLNARATLNTLLRLGAVPIINENDTVATQELRYGDNDRLAARVASMVSADCLILFSDIDGLYRVAPKAGAQLNPDDHIAEIDDISPDILAMAGEAGSPHGSGGMKTKLEAARIASDGGCHMVLTTGHPQNPLTRLLEGGRATFFRAPSNAQSARKAWISGALTPAGHLVIDSGAVAALAAGRSLLPVGIAQIKGYFERGDCVLICDPDGNELGRGLTAYSSEDAARIIGRKSDAIAKILGYTGRTEIIHRDDLILKREDLS
jgi:glutamate 5-kinase